MGYRLLGCCAPERSGDFFSVAILPTYGKITKDKKKKERNFIFAKDIISYMIIS